MFRLTKQEFETFKRRNDPEVFTKAQMDSWIEDVKEDFIKGEISELDEPTTKLVEEFKAEIGSFIHVQVIGEGLDPLMKGLSYSEFYLRPKQVEWTEEDITKSIDGKDVIEKSRYGTYTNTSLNRKLGRVGQKFGNAGQGVKKVEHKLNPGEEHVDFEAELLDKKKTESGSKLKKFSDIKEGDTAVDYNGEEYTVVTTGTGKADYNKKALKGTNKNTNMSPDWDEFAADDDDDTNLQFVVVKTSKGETGAFTFGDDGVTVKGNSEAGKGLNELDETFRSLDDFWGEYEGDDANPKEAVSLNNQLSKLITEHKISKEDFNKIASKYKALDLLFEDYR